MDIPRMGLPDHLAARLSMAEQHELLRKKHRVSRRGMLVAGAAGAGAVAAASIAGRAFADKTPEFWQQPDRLPGHLVVPFARHLAYGANPRSQVSVGWQVPSLVTRPFVRYGDSPWNLGHKVPAEIRALHSEVPGAIAPVDQYYVHASLNGLQPGKTYFYAVGHDGFDPTDLSTFGRVDSFTTAPSRRRVAGPFTFTAFGDQGVSYHALSNDGIIAQQNPVFHLHAGDIAYADPSGQGKPVSADGSNGTDVYDPRTWDQFLAQTESIAASVPWMVATGNHDMEALYSPNGYGGDIARFDFPGNGPQHCPSVYSYIYGNVAVVSLDANDVSYEIPANLGYSGGSQTKWLEDRLQFLRQQPDVDFIVVFFHHCAYSTTNQHASEGGVRTQWVPLFDKYQVDLVVNGHNHIYERADTLKGGVSKKTPIGATTHPDKDGTTYVTAGAAGRSLYSFPVPDSYAGHVNDLDSVPSYVWANGAVKVTETVTWSRVRYTGYSFLAVDVQPAAEGRKTSLTLRALTEAGQEIDRVVIERTAGGDSRKRTTLSEDQA
ncbi:purple acid phosphatase family protein [Dactylosporangium sp. CA-139066]|uniref:purple acid phosphatase family protein n=1 Tax=Dactylosporangium sp. CA-139066 TaxID=3239930 RepID=UPI003D9442F3